MFQNGYYHPTQNRMPGLRGYPVSSFEEARAAVVDFDGSIFLFPDIVNKRIYTKQINMDGTATLNMYELMPLPTTAPNNFITKEEFEAKIEELKNTFLVQQQQQAMAPQQPQPKERPIF